MTISAEKKKKKFRAEKENGRPRETRTRYARLKRAVLYQVS